MTACDACSRFTTKSCRGNLGLLLPILFRGPSDLCAIVSDGLRSRLISPDSDRFRVDPESIESNQRSSIACTLFTRSRYERNGLNGVAEVQPAGSFAITRRFHCDPSRKAFRSMLTDSWLEVRSRRHHGEVEGIRRQLHGQGLAEVGLGLALQSYTVLFHRKPAFPTLGLSL